MAAAVFAPRLRPLLALGLLLLQAGPALGFKWHLLDTLPSKKILTFSERYMFATRDGPEMLEEGDSYIEVDAMVTAYMTVNRSSTVGYAVYASADQHHHDTLLGICGDEDIRVNGWASNVYSRRVPTRYVGTRTVYANSAAAAAAGLDGLNGTYFLWQSHLASKYPVQKQAWHNVAFQLCTDENAGPLAKVDGGVTFRNPYGFIPAELYGFLPFEGARMVAYVLFAAFYLFSYCRHKASVLPLHTATLGVVVIALAEATTWYAAYQTINLTGQPYCCPFPPVVVGSLVLQVFRQTASRTLLLVVSLGYGIVRPRLMAAEWVAIVIVTAAYFTFATVARVSEIILVHDVHAETQDQSILRYQVPGMFMDVVVLTWIYFALTSTLRILTEFQQLHKLKMYRRLAATIVVFLVLFGLAAVPALLGGWFALPWEWAWVQQVMWECLNFAVLVAVCLVCLPSDNSRLLSYASQLPQDDPDADGADGSGLGMGMVDGESGGPDSADDDYDYSGGDGSDGGLEMTAKYRASLGNKYALPGALDEEGDDEFGLRED